MLGLRCQQRGFQPAGQQCHKQAPRFLRRAASSHLTIVCKESRVGKAPIPLPKTVEAELLGQLLKVKGPKGSLEVTFPASIKVEKLDGLLKVSKVEDTRQAAAFHGLFRSLANNAVVGVSTGFEKTLELIGTGYRASVSGQDLQLNVGYSNPRVLKMPEGVKVVVEKNTTLKVSGYDKVVLGDFCATVRMQRPPEPYKGKGIRYKGEVIKLKEGKGGGKKK